MDVKGGEIIFTIRHRPEKLRCPQCRSKNIILPGTVPRRFWTWSIGPKTVSIDLDVQRVEGRDGGVVRQVELGFADPRHRYTRAFEHYVLSLSHAMTITDLANLLHVSWDVIKDIIKRNLGRRFAHPKLKKLKRIAIDEIAVGRGGRCLTIVIDLKTGEVVFIGEGRGAAALAPFWRKLRAAHAHVKAVAMDMSPASIAAVQKNLADAAIVFDHFHVIKLFNEKLSDFRRELHRETTSLLQKQVLKGARWLLLKAPENLDDSRNERQRLQEALRINQPLALAYLLKEDLRTQLWGQPSKADAERFLYDWCHRAENSGIRFLIQFANLLLGYRTGILNYYHHPISTGPLEGLNNKIKTMKRQAYGYRDPEFFKLKILALHEAKYALVG
jgi:transposase